jgi:ubiquinone/menaquinone biosynthesis C-methylase UbiE
MSDVPVESSVRNRYSDAAKTREAALCCPVQYDAKYLAPIPADVIERDYGCGDPSAYVRPGETILDLGSGSGKICFIASQVVGPTGRVIGVDMNDDMLALSRRAAGEVAAKVGYANVEFRKGRIQDLRLDRDKVDAFLKRRPLASEADLVTYEEYAERLAAAEPLVADGSIDAVVSNCVLNLVSNRDKLQLFRELFRVLKRGGRAVISDIIADEPIPQALAADPTLWSGCIAGAFEETAFLKAFEAAGFYGVELVKRDREPWQTVGGIEFRSATVIAYKGKDGPCWDHHEALIYKGPFSAVTDDDGHTFPRGERVAVCRKTFEIFTKAPYAEHFYAVEPLEAVAPEEAQPFPCMGGVLRRSPRATKGEDYTLTATGPNERGASACGPGGSCC